MSEQTPEPVDADDPGLTAYALGECVGAEAARYAAAVSASVELQAVVAEIQQAARILSDELRLEPAVSMSVERRAEILAQASSPQPAKVRQRRIFGISRRTLAVAASVLLVPGAWYAFQAAFPRMKPSQMMAQREKAVSNSYLGDDVQYFPVGPTNWTPSPERALQRNAGPDADLSVAVGDSADKFHHITSDPQGDSKKWADKAPLSVEGPAVEMLAQPGPMVNGPGLGVMPMAPDADTYAEATNGPGFIGDAGQKIPVRSASPAGALAGSRRLTEETQFGDLNKGSPGRGTPERLSFGVGIGGVGGGAPPSNPQLPQLLPRILVKEEEGLYLGVPSSSAGMPRKSDEARQAPESGPGTMVGRIRGREIQSQSEQKLSKPHEGQGEATPAAADSQQRLIAELEQYRLRQGSTSKPGEPSKPQTFKPQTFDFSDESLDDVKAAIMGQPADPTSQAAYHPIFENGFVTPQEQQLSTFSIDVDTASYANVRRYLQAGQLPPPDAVRIEELINYFSYQYPQPQDGRPFSVQTDIAACPWQPSHQLVRIGLKGKEIPPEQRSPTNLVFLVDVSGSMAAQNKLPLVRESLTTLVKQLDERDRVAIVTYAGEAGVRLPSTSIAQREVVLAAIAGLGAGGSTNGAAGINTAYDIAAQEFLEQGMNRVILCTDGDFNVGVTSDAALVEMIQTRAKGGVFLSVFGFGMGNLKDAKLEQLADKGNGQYGYIDDQQEANKVFVHELMGTLVTIAKDVKIQVDFNKDTVASYRLVGYENRVMAAEDFHDDKKDAGEIGAGHTVTALYEIVPTQDLITNDQTRWLTVKLRYKQPTAATSVLFENPLVGQPGQLKVASSDFQFVASVAAFGMLLRHSQHAGQANWSLVKELAQSGLSHDPHGHRRGFLSLVAQGESLLGQIRPVSPPASDSTAGGKYKSLLRRLHVPTDAEKYGQFNDRGQSTEQAYAGAENLPAGYWVYAAPYWYIWAEKLDTRTGPVKN